MPRLAPGHFILALFIFLISCKKMAASAGYSGTPLVKKLGFSKGFSVRIVHAPDNYLHLLGELPENIRFSKEKKSTKQLIHYFTKKRNELERDIVLLRKEIFPTGMIWISWPKKAAKIDTDITEDTVRALALQNGLVDVKVCAVDETWSALKLVVPVKDRNLSS
jgi:hypothetical protein